MVRSAVDGSKGSSLRERKKAQTREAIIEAALTLFERHGYDATTVEDIAAAANISPRTFFRYFDSKLEVVFTESDGGVEDFAALVAARPAHEGAVEAMRQASRLLASEEVLQTGSRLEQEVNVLANDPTLRSLTLEHLREHEVALRPVLAQRLEVEADSFEARTVASLITTVMWSVFEYWAAEGRDAEELFSLLDRGFALLSTKID